jgi:fructose-1-phosphate kinase PfkB-like protein
LRSCARELDAVRAPGVSLALCGSFPGWNSAEAAPMRDALAHWAEEKALFVDTYGPPLQWALQQPVSLIKINRDEFDDLFSAAEQKTPVTERVAQALDRWPVETWIVTDGGKTVTYGGRSIPVGTAMPPPVKEISATGSGDVLFACVLHALLTQKKELSEALQFALPYAAANASHPGVAEFDLNNLPTLRSFQP